MESYSEIINIPDNVPEFKIILIGDGGVGKTTFIKQFALSENHSRYVHDRLYGHNRLGIYFATNYGLVHLNVWHSRSQERTTGFRDGYFLNAAGAIIMFDLTSRMTYKNIASWYRDITRVCDNIPIALVGNKADIEERKIKTSQIVFHKKKNIPYFEISAKSNFQIYEPFVWLMRKLLKVNDSSQFYLVKEPELGPKQIEMNTDLIQKIDRDLKELNKKNSSEDDIF